MSENKDLSVLSTITFIGALLAYLIGAGFASGQEVLQFYSSWGSLEAIAIIGFLNFFLMFTTYTAFAYAGRTRGLYDATSIFEFYTNKPVALLFTSFIWLYNFGCYFFMVSGFAHTLHQQWGVPVPVGGAISVILSVGTVILGVKKMVAIIGRIGPAIVTIALIIGGISAFELYPNIPDGLHKIQSGAVEMINAGANPVLAGFSFAGTCIIIVAAYLGRMGMDLKDYKFKYNKIIIFAVAFIYPVCCIVLALNYFGLIDEIAVAAIPNLVLAERILPAISLIFAIIILAAVYSTMCPIIWTCVSMLVKDENSLKYKLTCISGAAGVYIVTLYIPYQKLLNGIMTYGGYSGAITGIVITLCYVIQKSKDKTAGLSIN